MVDTALAPTPTPTRGPAALHGGQGQPQRLLSLSRGVGTPLWSAPEILRKDRNYGPSIDLYSFGIMMWELVTRDEPWADIGGANQFDMAAALEASVQSGKRPPTGADHDWPEVYTALMRSCWATDPTERPSFQFVVDTLKEG